MQTVSVLQEKELRNLLKFINISERKNIHQRTHRMHRDAAGDAPKDTDHKNS